LRNKTLLEQAHIKVGFDQKAGFRNGVYYNIATKAVLYYKEK